jgi:hypothetical protein
MVKIFRFKSLEAESLTGGVGSFTRLTANSGTVTTNSPALSVSQTWNNAAQTFVAAEIVITRVNQQTNSAAFRVRDSGGNNFFNIDLFGTTQLGFTRCNGLALTNNSSVQLFSGGTNILEQIGGTAAQTFRLYNTVSGGSNENFERLSLRWVSNVAIIGTEKGNTGLARPLEFQTDGVTRMTIAATGAVTFSTGIVASQGGEFNNFVSFNHNVNIQAGGRQLQVTTIAAVSTMTLNSGGVIRWSTTNLFPSLRHSGTTLRVRLADDTDFAPFTAGLITATGNLVLTDNDGAQTATFDAQSKLTANRTYDLPDQSGTLALKSEVRSDFVSPYVYTGLASAGTAENIAFWKIRRSQFNDEGSYITTLTAINVKWEDRLTASYT